MTRWSRRSVLQTGAAFAVGGLFATVGVSADGETKTSLEEPDGWWTSRADAGNTASVPSDDLADPATIAWTYDETGDFVVADGTVYLQTGSGVHAIDADDGDRRWDAEDLDASGSPSVIDETVYVGGGAVTALDAETGEARWRRELDDDATVELVAFGAVYAVTEADEPTLYALDTDDGSIRWECETVTVDADDGTDESQEYVVEPVVTAVDDTLYTVVEAPDDHEYALVALEPDAGEIQWTAFHEDSGAEFGGLAVTEERAIVQYESPREEPRVFVFDLEARSFEAAISKWGSEGVAIDGDRVALTGETHLSFHDVSTISDDHTETWSYGTATGFGAPVIASDVVVTATNFGDRDDPNNDVVIAFDVADGSKAWRFTFDGVEWGERPSDPVASPVVDDRTIYITRDESLVALPARDDDDGDGDDGSDGNDDDAEDETEADDEASDPDEGDDSGDDAPEDDSDDEAGYDGDETDETDDGSDETGAGDDETGAGDAGSDDTGSDDQDDASESDADPDNQDDAAEADDDVPGFTTGAGVAGGALTLEWLRRRARTTERADPDE